MELLLQVMSGGKCSLFASYLVGALPGLPPFNLHQRKFNRLPGTPDLLLSFSKSQALSDCSFHPCVRLVSFFLI